MTQRPEQVRTVYLAARYSRREEMLEVAKKLTALGYEVTSRWITGAHELPGKRDGNGPVPYTVEERKHFATEDLEDIDRAALLISFTEPEKTVANRGGRHVEHGYALAKGKVIFVVGHMENVFHCYKGSFFPDTEALLSMMAVL